MKGIDIMTEQELRTTIELANCVLAKNDITTEYRKEIEGAKAAAQTELTLIELESFKQHMINILDNQTADEDFALKMYDSKIQITFAGKTIAVEYGAAMYNAIYGGIQEVIDDYSPANN